MEEQQYVWVKHTLYCPECKTLTEQLVGQDRHLAMLSCCECPGYRFLKPQELEQALAQAEQGLSSPGLFAEMEQQP